MRRSGVALGTGLALACAVAAAISAAKAAATPKPDRYESVCQIVARRNVERDEANVPTLVDLELEWDPCPGDQFQFVRGGKEFAACTEKYELGELVPVTVVHYWDPHGFYTWDIERLGDCKHAVDPAAEGSFEKSQECNETASYGNDNGFRCDRLPNKGLVKVCPWTARN